MGKMLRNLIVLSSWWTLKITQGVNSVQLSRDFLKKNILVIVPLQYELRRIKEKVRSYKSYVSNYKAVYGRGAGIIRALKHL